MPNTYAKLANVTIGVNGADSITFGNIPQNYTDLKIILSTRSTPTPVVDNRMRWGNGGPSAVAAYYYFSVLGTGSGTPSWDIGNSTATTQLNTIGAGSTSTTNAFSNVEIRIFNYANSLVKHAIADAVVEANSASTLVQIRAQSFYWNNTAAINTIEFSLNSGTYSQYTTATLYGIRNS